MITYAHTYTHLNTQIPLPQIHAICVQTKNCTSEKLTVAHEVFIIFAAKCYYTFNFSDHFNLSLHTKKNLLLFSLCIPLFMYHICRRKYLKTNKKKSKHWTLLSFFSIYYCWANIYINNFVVVYIACFMFFVSVFSIDNILFIKKQML